MISNYALISAWSYALVSIAYLFLLLKMIENKYEFLKNKVAGVFLVSAITSTILWGFFELLNSVLKGELLSLISATFDFTRYLFWCLFIVVILCVDKRRLKKLYLFSILVFAFVYFSILWLSFSKDWFYFELENHVKIDDVGRFFRLAFSIFSLVLIERLFFSVVSDDRWKLKPLIIGLSSILIFDLYIYSEDILFKKIDADASAVRGLIHAFVVPLLFTSLASRARNNFRFKLSKATVFNSFALALSGIYLILISSVAYYVKYFGGDWGQALQVALVYGSLVIFTVIVFSNNFRSIIKVYIGKNFFHYIYDYREDWLKFTNLLVVQDSNPEMGKQIIKAFSNILESPAGSLWMKKGNDGAFNQVAHMNQTHTHLSEDSKSLFCRFMNSTGWVIDIEQYRRAPELYGALKLPDWINDFPGTWLIVPLLAGEELIGFCTLDKPRNPVSVNWEVNDLLKTAGRQAAGFLAQMQATEALLESRKFAAFNRMSAFVVHDLKNIVTQLSLMMRNSQRLLSNPEFQNDMLLTVDNSLVRMRQLMRQLHEGPVLSAPASGVDLEVLIDRLVARSIKSGRKIKFDLSSPAAVRGQEDRLERVLGHLIQNALDATDAAGSVRISLDADGDRAQVVLCDTGCGMSPEFVASSLFKPFQTTKQHGMGIGAYECALYIQELGGAIHVDSTLGVGTTLTLSIPLFGATACMVDSA